MSKLVDAGDQNGQNRHKHRIVVANKFCLQHPVTNIDVTRTKYDETQNQCVGVAKEINNKRVHGFTCNHF